MSDTIEAVKAAVRAFLAANCTPVPAATTTSNKVHLEVWETRGERRRPVGLEMDHDEVVNIWVTAMNVPRELPESATIAHKRPVGARSWTDDNGDGANSNLASYDAFRTKKIARIGVRSVADAKAVLAWLAR